MPKLNLEQARTEESRIVKALEALQEDATDERRKMKKQLKRMQRRRRALSVGVPDAPEAAPKKEGESEGEES